MVKVSGSSGTVVWRGRGNKAAGGKEAKRPMAVRRVTPLSALMSALSLPGMPVCDLTLCMVMEESVER